MPYSRSRIKAPTNVVPAYLFTEDFKIDAPEKKFSRGCEFGTLEDQIYGMVQGYYSGYPDCCVAWFINSDFWPGRPAALKAQREAGVGYVPCVACVEAGPQKVQVRKGLVWLRTPGSLCDGERRKPYP